MPFRIRKSVTKTFGSMVITTFGAEIMKVAYQQEVTETEKLMDFSEQCENTYHTL